MRNVLKIIDDDKFVNVLENDIAKYKNVKNMMLSNLGIRSNSCFIKHSSINDLHTLIFIWEKFDIIELYGVRPNPMDLKKILRNDDLVNVIVKE